MAKLKHRFKLKKLLKREGFKHGRFSRANLTIFAIIFAAIGGYFIYSSFAAGADTANLWVDTNGGTCTRSATPVAYDDATACTPSDLDTAYSSAQCGDTVKIKAQSLPDQILNASPKSGCSSNILFEPAAGESVTFSDDLEIDGPSYMTFKDMAATTPGSGGTAGNLCDTVVESPSQLKVFTTDAQSGPGQASHNIIIDNLDGFKKFGIYGWVEDITIRNSTFGPACDNQPQLNTFDGSSNSVQRPHRVTIENNIMHDFARSDTAGHTECLQLINGEETTVRGNVLYNCDGTAALGGNCCQNVTIENNTFQIGTGDAFYACQLTREQTGTQGLIFRHNSSTDGCAFVDTEAFTHLLFEGNYMPFSSSNCIDQSINNVYKGGTCNASDKNVSSLVFADAANHNLHITASSTDAIGAEATCSVTDDIDGDTRPSTNCDAGADQLVAGSPDTTGPTVSITSPTAGATVSGGSVAVNANASDDVGVAGVQFKVDGSNIGSEDTSSPYSVSWDTSTLPNGNHTLTAVALDRAGNTTTSSSVSVTVSNAPDTTKPTVSVTAPVAGSTVTGSVTLSANAADNVSVIGVQFKVDGVNVGAEDTSSPYSISWDSSSVSNGTHTITAVARDGAGNTATSSGVTVTVQSPVITLSLVNADSDTFIGSMTNGMTINLTNEPTRNLNIDAAINTTAGSMAFDWDGTTDYRTQNAVPYSFGGDSNGQYDPWTPPLGSHTLTAKFYSGSSQTGTLLASKTISFTVTDSGSKLGDINNDGNVDIFDLSIMLSHYNTSTANCDLNSDNTVNIFDLSILLSHYGT